MDKLFMKKILLLYILIIPLLSSCNQTETNSIRFGLSAAPINLDPRFATDATSVRIGRLLYRSLVDFDKSLLPTPELATWKQVTATHYRFTLGNDGRKFHNGKSLTAKDVKATYDFILDKKNASPHKGGLSVIKEIKVIDDNTIEFFLNKVDALFPGRLVIGILPTDMINNQHPFNKKPVGSGDFKFIKWEQTGNLSIQRQSDGQMVEFIEVKDPVVRALKLVRGEVDILQNDLPPESIEWLAKRSEVKITKAQGSNFSYLGFNLENDVTGKFAIREAIAYAVNREEIIKSVLGNAARIARSFMLPATHWAGHPNLPTYDYNPEKARAILAELGYNKENPLKLSYKTSNNPVRIRVATVMQQHLKYVNIDMDLRTYDWGTFYGDIKSGRFQMYSLAWVGIKMPDIFQYVFHSKFMPPNGANRGRLNDSEIDALIDQASVTSNLSDQAVLYKKLQEKLLKKLPYVPLWYEDHVLATTKHVSGYELAADGNYDGLKTVMIK
jgi:peptide/nickel transport system substrate-binding protein